MTSEVRRIMLAMDATRREEHSLRDATRIAAQFNAEVTAALVTNPSLQRFAQLPIATEVLHGSARSRRVNPADLDADMERALNELRYKLSNLAGQADVAWNVISAPLEELSSTSSPDLLLVDRRAGHTPVSRIELGSIAATLAAQFRKSILIFERELALDKPVSVLVDTDAGAPLAMALDLARTSKQLRILIDAADDESFRQMRERLRSHAAHRDIAVDTDWVRAPRANLLSSYLYTRGDGMLVISATAAVLMREGLAGLLGALRTPLLLAR